MTDPQMSILVVEDDKAMRLSLVELLEAAGWKVDALSGADKVAAHLQSDTPDVILSDVRMPRMSGLELLAELQDAHAPPVVLISAHGDIAMAVEAIQQGAYSFVEKPYDPRRLLSVLKNAARQARMRLDNQRLRRRLSELSGLDRILLGQNARIADLRRLVTDIADTSAPVLILGETGTGKELVARALHDLSDRAAQPFVALNCATLNADRFEEDMFGIAGGPPGRITAADGGTLFLDEISAGSLDTQAKLLRVIEDGQIWPIGSPEPVTVSFRLLAATNEDLDKAVSEGRFRSDLLFRLNALTLTLPPLRDRTDDIVLLATHFLREQALLYGAEVPDLSSADTAALLAHDWPGNIRELRHTCARHILGLRSGGSDLGATLEGVSAAQDTPPSLREAVAAFERSIITRALQSHQGRMDDVAAALGIGRRTLNEKIVKLGLDKDKVVGPPASKPDT